MRRGSLPVRAQTRRNGRTLHTIRYSGDMIKDVRARLLEAALELMASRGYEAVGVQEIVSAAGVTKPTLYHYFGSKQGLLAALLLEGSGAFLETLRAAAEYAGDLPLTLDRTADAFLAFAARQPRFFRLQLGLAFTPPDSDAREPATRLRESQLEILERLFVAATRDHGNMRGRQQRYAFSLLGVLDAYAARIVDGSLRPSERMRRELVHQFSHGIYS